LSKDEEIYNVFDTVKILSRSPGVAVSDKSGAAGIVHWINSTLKLSGERRVEKQHPGVARIVELIERQYDTGRTTSISNEEMLFWTKEYLPELF